MTVPVFVDTNVLIYSRDAGEPLKASSARDWLKRLGSNGIILSPQVLNEVYSVGLARFRPVGTEALAAWISELQPLCRAPLDAATVMLALDLHRDAGISWWDCPIVASALQAGCRYLLSEDMQHRRVIRSVQVINPFLADPADLLDRN